MAYKNDANMQSNNKTVLAKRNYIEEEQPFDDNIDVTFDPNSPKCVLNKSLEMEALASRNLSKDTITMRRFKSAQIEEYVNEYSISQVEQSGFASFLNIVNAIFVTIALALAFLVAFGLLFGLRICSVISDSMEPTILKGSLVIVKPIDYEDIQVGNVISYVKTDGWTYIHRVAEIEVNGDNASEYILVMEGDNQDKYPGYYESIGAFTVQGEFVISIPGMGDFLLWLRVYWYVAVAGLITLIIGMSLIKRLVDEAHNKKVVQNYVEQRKELDKQMLNKQILYRKQKEKEELESLLFNKKR